MKIKTITYILDIILVISFLLSLWIIYNITNINHIQLVCTLYFIVFLILFLILRYVFYRNRTILNFYQDYDWNKLHYTLSNEIFNNRKVYNMNIIYFTDTCIYLENINDFNYLVNFLKDNFFNLYLKYSFNTICVYLYFNHYDSIFYCYNIIKNHIKNNKDIILIRWVIAYTYYLKGDITYKEEFEKLLKNDDLDHLLKMISIYLLYKNFKDDPNIINLCRIAKKNISNIDNKKKVVNKIYKKMNIRDIYILNNLINDVLVWINIGKLD